MRVRAKILVLLLAFFLVPAAMLAVATEWTAREALEKQVGAASLELLRAQNAFVQEVVDARFRAVNEHSHEPVYGRVADLRDPDVGRHLRGLARALPEFAYVAAVDTEGRVASAVGADIVGREYYETRGAAQPAHQDLIAVEVDPFAGEPTLTYVVPIGNEDETRGTLVAALKWQYVHDILRAITIRGRTQDAADHLMLLRRDGTVLSAIGCPVSSGRPLSTNLVQEGVRSARNVVAGHAGSRMEDAGPALTGFVTYAPFPREGLPKATGWSMMMVQDPAAVFALGAAIRAEATALALLGTMSVLVVAFVVSARVTRRLSALSAASARVQAGDLGVRIADPTRDEFGDLARSFDRMIGSLESAGLELRRSGEFTENILTSMSEMVMVVSSEGRVVRANPATLRALGVSMEALANRPVAAFLRHTGRGRDDAEPLIPANGFDSPEEMVLCGGARGQVAVLVSAAALLERSVAQRGMVVVATDITALRDAEKTSRLLATAVEQAGDSIVITDTEGHIEYVNPAFERISGYAREEVLGRNPRVLKSGKHDAAFYADMWRTIRDGRVWEGRFFNTRKDGTPFEEEATISPVRDDVGATVAFVAVKHDVTERARLTAEMRQAQKMEAVGRLAGGVAHDFNNLLTVINGFAHLTLSRMDAADPRRSGIERIEQAGKRAAGLTQQMLAFSRKQILQPVVLELNELVKETERMLGRVIGEDVRVETVLAPDLAHVTADSGQIVQVIMNLAVNARDAMPRGGKLTIETRNVSLDDAFAQARPELEPGEYVALRVADTGVGMDAATLSRIFEPFFTTKEGRGGTGLGLSTVYGIVRQSGGYIDVSSAPGRGAEFTVYLPRLAVHEASGHVSGDAPRAPRELERGVETVLVIEDEEGVRDFAHEALEELGYTVLMAETAHQAMELCRGHSGPIHLVLTDVVMPETSGPEAWDRIRNLRPESRVIFMSGYPADAVGATSGLDEPTRLLRKPFTISVLARVVRRALDQPLEQAVGAPA